MNKEEFSLLFHRAQVNLVAFKMLYEPEAFEAMQRMVEMAVAEEREAVLQTIEALYDTQDPNPMYKEGYNHALDNIEEFIKGRANATLSEQGDKHET